MDRKSGVTMLNQLSALASAYQLVKDPNRLTDVLNLSDRLTDLATPEDLKALARELEKTPQAVEAIQKRVRVHSSPHRRFSRYAKSSLGRAYFEHLQKNGIVPEALAPSEIHDDISYIRAHFYETHDIWHTVTGFDISVAGELGLAAFGAAQFPSVFNFVLLAGGLLNTALYEFSDRDQRMDAITRGWTMGRKAKKLFGVEWDALWSVPLGQVRKQFNI